LVVDWNQEEFSREVVTEESEIYWTFLSDDSSPEIKNEPILINLQVKNKNQGMVIGEGELRIVPDENGVIFKVEE